MPLLTIESALASTEASLYHKYSVLKHKLLTELYPRSAQGFPEGNDHGAEHIKRVLTRLDQLVGADSTGLVRPYELYLSMMSVLYHDIGIVRARDNHATISGDALTATASAADERGRLTYIHDNENFLFDPYDRDVIVAAVVSHSSSTRIEDACKSLPVEFEVANNSVRPRRIAALVRLADELDEDYRRAPNIIETIAVVPPTSQFYWDFCRRISGIHVERGRGRITIHAKLEPNDVGRVVKLREKEGIFDRLFVFAFAEKLAKINSERKYTNSFLQPDADFRDLAVTLRPLDKHDTWTAPRTFTFSDDTSAGEFLNSFPELLHAPADRDLLNILILIAQKKYIEARIELSTYYRHAPALTPKARGFVRYNLACVESRIAQATTDASVREESLLAGYAHLAQWIREGVAGDWLAQGSNPRDEVERVNVDDDLFYLLGRMASEVQEVLPADLKPIFRVPTQPSGRGGCVERGTLVDTPTGPTPIERIRVGDEVLSFDTTLWGLQVARVVAVRLFKAPISIQINSDVRMTPGQRVYSSRRGWSAVDTLSIGDEILHGNSAYVDIASLVRDEGAFEVFALETDHPTHNFLARGVVCHNMKL